MADETMPLCGLKGSDGVGHTGQMQTSGETAGHKHGCYDITANKTRRACREIV